MVKRRNSPYAPHDRQAKTRTTMDCTPHMVAPDEREVRPARMVAKMWSPNNVEGGFFL